jgi:hypothetical protein
MSAVANAQKVRRSLSVSHFLGFASPPLDRAKAKAALQTMQDTRPSGFGEPQIEQFITLASK